MRIHQEGGLIFARIERKTLAPRSVLLLDQSSLCSLHDSRNQGGEESNGHVVSIKRAADRSRNAGRSLMKREKSTGIRMNTCKTSQLT